MECLFFAQVYFSNKTVSQTTVSTGPMKMFRLDHKTIKLCLSKKCILVTWSAGLTKLATFFRVLKAWCHCDFRKMEALKVNKFGQTYCTGTQAAQAIVVRSYCFFNLYVSVQLVKCDIVTALIYYYITTEIHYAKRGLRETYRSQEKQVVH